MDEHSGYSSRPAEVSVDVEKGLSIHEIWIGAPTLVVSRVFHRREEGEQLRVKLVGPITIPQPSP